MNQLPRDLVGLAQWGKHTLKPVMYASELRAQHDLPVHESGLDERVPDEAPEGHLAARLRVDVPAGVPHSLDAHLRNCGQNSKKGE